MDNITCYHYLSSILQMFLCDVDKIKPFFITWVTKLTQFYLTFEQSLQQTETWCHGFLTLYQVIFLIHLNNQQINCFCRIETATY